MGDKTRITPELIENEVIKLLGKGKDNGYMQNNILLTEPFNQCHSILTKSYDSSKIRHLYNECLEIYTNNLNGVVEYVFNQVVEKNSISYVESLSPYLDIKTFNGLTYQNNRHVIKDINLFDESLREHLNQISAHKILFSSLYFMKIIYHVSDEKLPEIEFAELSEEERENRDRKLIPYLSILALINIVYFLQKDQDLVAYDEKYKDKNSSCMLHIANIYKIIGKINLLESIRQDVKSAASDEIQIQDLTPYYKPRQKHFITAYIQHVENSRENGHAVDMNSFVSSLREGTHKCFYFDESTGNYLDTHIKGEKPFTNRKQLIDYYINNIRNKNLEGK